MKSRKLISFFALGLAAASGACSSGSQPAADEQTSTTEQAQILGTAGNIIAFPTGPITWDELNGTFPISVFSPTTIGALAFGVTGVNNLGVTALGFPGLVATPITTGLLNAFVPPIGTAGVLGLPFFGTSGLIAPAFGFTGAFNPVFGAGFGFGAFGPAGALTGTFANGLLTTPGFGGLGFFTPTLTSSALTFSNLAAINAFTPFTFNVTFQAQSAAQIASLSTAALSVFATPILPSALAMTTGVIPFTSFAFPIIPLPLAAATPVAPLL
jgi:hypothetical protein